MRIYDVMTRDVVTAHPDTPLKDVARLLRDNGIGGLPVVDEHNKVVGVISETDFVAKERGADYIPRSAFDRMAGRTARDKAKVAATTAGEAMTTPAIVIEGRIASVREAAIVMLDHGVNRIPITDKGVLVGIITRGDLVAIFAQADTTIAARVRESLRAVDGLTVEGVTEGIVTLSGTVASPTLADAAVSVAGSAEGVIGVSHDRLASRDGTAPPGDRPLGLSA